MNEAPQPDFILAGVPKAATTWIHECFREHPDVLVPESDAVSYFDLNYDVGSSWYARQFPERGSESVVGEASPGYLMNTHAAERIAETVPETTLLFCLRNPIERAFSQWWHGYSDHYWTYEFEDTFGSQPAYQIWVAPGFYDHHLRRFDDLFDDDQIELLFFDDLVADDAAFIADVFDRIGVDPGFVPSVVDRKVNTAHYQGPSLVKRARNWVETSATGAVRSVLQPVASSVSSVVLDRGMYEEGMSPEMRRRLERVYRDDIDRLEERTGRDLDHWFESIDR